MSLEYSAKAPALAPMPAELAHRFPEGALAEIRRDMEQLGGPYVPPADTEGSVGVTMFDTPSAEDDTIPVVLCKENLSRLPSQAMVRIRSRDGRSYLGVVVRGPYALPDGLKADAPPVVATAIRGGFFMPEYHGLVVVEIMGEERKGQVHPHRFRPLPNSSVFVLEQEEVRAFLRTGGEIRLGRAFGYDDLEVAFPCSPVDPRAKGVLPRHTAILGTTGGGKSTTVANLVGQLQAAGAAVILLDTEGEYTEMDQKTEDPTILTALEETGRSPAGIPHTALLHLVGRPCANPKHQRVTAFSPRFADISPYAALELLDLNEAQEDRFTKALDVTVRALDDLDIWSDEERHFVKEGLDEFDGGYPRMRLSHLYDVVRATADALDSKGGSPNFILKSPEFRGAGERFSRLLDTSTKSVPSWRKLQGKLARVDRLNIFDNPNAKPLKCSSLIQAGRVSIVDLSGTESTLVNNLVISDLLRGIQRAQEDAYAAAEREGKDPTPVVVIIEEAHEFLSAQRIGKMPILHQQIERIAKRGRKRWLGLVFVTQLPQHLPDEILGLVNNLVLHKIGDPNVVSRLKRTVGGLDDSLWSRLPRLAPGQAVVSLSSLSRPLLTAMDPATCRLRMVR